MLPQLDAEPASRSKARVSLFSAVIPLLAFLGLVVAVQLVSGVYRGEAGNEYDEAGHFLSGLMIRDYAVSGLHSRPLQYAENYYLHYPKFAIGMFPPLFHFLLAIWLLPFGTFAAGLAFMALITACLAWQARAMLLPEYGGLVATAAASVIVFLPLIRQLTSEVMLDSMVALFAILVVRYTARFLDSGATKDAFWLGVFGAAGCLVKGNGVGALLCPALAIVLTGRYRLLRRPGLYVAALVVVGLAAPIEWISLRTYQKNLSFLHGGLAFSKIAAPVYLSGLWVGGGIAMLFAAAGMLRKAMEWRKTRQIDMLWPSLYAMFIGTLVFHIVVPQIPSQRYMSTAIVTAALFLPCALTSLREKVQAGALAGVAILAMATGPALEVPLGFNPAVQWLQKQPQYSKALIVSDALGEGAFVTGVADSDGSHRPEHSAVRASKLLARSDWNSRYYYIKFQHASEALHYLEELGIRYVVLDTTPGTERSPHQIQMGEAMQKNADRVSLVAQFPEVAGKRSRSVEVYALNFAAAVPRLPLRYSLDSTLGYEIGN